MSAEPLAPRGAPPGRGDSEGAGGGAVAFGVYNAVLLAALPFLAAGLGLACALGRRVGRTWRAQLGGELPAAPACRGAIWLQAASIGEGESARRLIEACRRVLPGRPILLTATSPEGLALARERGGADHVAAFPFDLPWVAGRWFEAYRPAICVMLETEIWPNFVRECSRRGVPLVMASGRLSPARMGRYRALRWLYRAFLRGFSMLLMQSDADAGRIVSLGASPDRVRVTGDLKFDGRAPEPPARPPGFPVLVAGSTHPGESETVLDVYRELRARRPELALVLAPRHSDTVEPVTRYAEELGLVVHRRSRGLVAAPGELLLVDTIGELAALYGMAAVAFVGGSLCPVGGHSLLEPARLGKPVLHGPHVHHQESQAALLAAAGAARAVADGRELLAAVEYLLDSPDAAKEMGRRGAEAVRAHAGAADRTAELLRGILEGA